MQIMIAECDHVDRYEVEVARILAALGHSEALVTDLSQLFDFWLGDEETTALEELMGRPVNASEFLWQMAQELADKPVVH
jgi:hypothetical protein